jgi:hypothetical protein
MESSNNYAHILMKRPVLEFQQVICMKFPLCLSSPKFLDSPSLPSGGESLRRFSSNLLSDPV